MQVFQEAMGHLIVRETKRQCRILGISAEHNTNVRITDEVPIGFLISQRNS